MQDRNSGQLNYQPCSLLFVIRNKLHVDSGVAINRSEDGLPVACERAPGEDGKKRRMRETEEFGERSDRWLAWLPSGGFSPSPFARRHC